MSPPSITSLFLSTLLIITIFTPLSHSQKTHPPNALLLPISKQLSPLQYLTNISIGNFLAQTTFLLDLSGKPLSLTCPINQVTSSYTISLPSTNGSYPGPISNIPNLSFACARNPPLKGKKNSVKGTVGLGRSSLGLSTQISSSLGPRFSHKFTICLPSSSSFFMTHPGKTSYNGVLFFGDTPYLFYPSYNETRLIDLKKRFSFTKLIVNPTYPSDYFVQVTSILVNKKPIQVNPTLLKINNKGIGGTKFSTVEPYMVLESSIYKALTTAFVKELTAMRVTKAKPVAPFTECFSTKFMPFTGLGPGVPDVTFVLENKAVTWELSGNGLMVEISREVLCLAVVDGGSRATTSVVIGAHQMEDNLFEFDLATSMLAFSYNTLLYDEVLCSNFNF